MKSTVGGFSSKAKHCPLFFRFSKDEEAYMLFQNAILGYRSNRKILHVLVVSYFFEVRAGNSRSHKEIQLLFLGKHFQDGKCWKITLRELGGDLYAHRIDREDIVAPYQIFRRRRSITVCAPSLKS